MNQEMDLSSSLALEAKRSMRKRCQLMHSRQMLSSSYHRVGAVARLYNSSPCIDFYHGDHTKPERENKRQKVALMMMIGDDFRTLVGAESSAANAARHNSATDRGCCESLILLERIYKLLASTDLGTKEDEFDISAGGGDLRLYCTSVLLSLIPTLQADGVRPRAVQVSLDALERYATSGAVLTESSKLLNLLLLPTDVVFFPHRSLSILVLSLYRSLRRHDTCHEQDPTDQILLLDLIRRFREIVPLSSSSSTSPTATANACCWTAPISSESDQATPTTLILQCMIRHPHHAVIQRIGFSMLAWLVAEDITARQQIVAHGGAGVVPKIMSIHINDSLVQCNAAATLCWLIHFQHHHPYKQDDQTPPETSQEVLSILLTILKCHINNCSVFGNVVCVLCGIMTRASSTSRAAAATVADLAFFPVISQGMKLHIESPKVQECCVRWIRIRCNHQTQQQEQVLSNATTQDTAEQLHNYFLSFCPLILQGMKRHAEDVHLQTQACELLTTVMCFDGDQAATSTSSADTKIVPIREELLKLGAVDVVLASLQLHKSDLRAQQSALWFMALLLRIGMQNNEAETTSFGRGVADFRVIETIWSATAAAANGQS